MRHPLEFLFPPEIGAELIYSFVIIICSLMIYYATKEIYELSSYKGLKYFRLSFLCFAIAYFFRYFIRFILAIIDIDHIVDLSPRFVFSSSLFLFLFFSSMAVFYLLYSVMWKKWSHNIFRISLFLILALIIAIAGTIFRSIETSLILNLIFLLFVSVILYIVYKESKNKQKNLFTIYILLFIFWVLNVLDILIPDFLQLFQLFIYLASTLLFMIILYKVLKRAGNL